ncbi:MAG: MotA/TolQ/ExbB proton channel family protein [Verrucomicrobiota bacterium JB023]|nr:MotA/TolQ/ExbB proton channel family protein [Verrucomicrobiota bacterium JB023]
MKFAPLLLFSTLPLLAQNDGAPAEASTEVPLLDIISRGGVMMYPLAVLALVTVILAILYLMTIRRSAVVTKRFMNAAETMLRQPDNVGLLSYASRRSELVARVTQRTLHFYTENPNATIGEVREVAEAEGSRQSSILAQRITWLGDIGTIAPMVGLLGTVIGMIKSFMQISAGEVGVLQQMLARGVYEALVTTAAGLVIGITAMIFHSYFRGRVNRYLSEFEAASTHIISLLSAQLKTPPQAPPPGYPPQPVYLPEADQHPSHQVVYPQS